MNRVVWWVLTEIGCKGEVNALVCLCLPVSPSRYQQLSINSKLHLINPPPVSVEAGGVAGRRMESTQWQMLMDDVYLLSHNSFAPPKAHRWSWVIHAVYTELLVMGSILILMFMNLFQKLVCCESSAWLPRCLFSCCLEFHIISCSITNKPVLLFICWAGIYTQVPVGFV